jgi:hypothetical protein
MFNEIVNVSFVFLPILLFVMNKRVLVVHHVTNPSIQDTMLKFIKYQVKNNESEIRLSVYIHIYN